MNEQQLLEFRKYVAGIHCDQFVLLAIVFTLCDINNRIHYIALIFILGWIAKVLTRNYIQTKHGIAETPSEVIHACLGCHRAALVRPYCKIHGVPQVRYVCECGHYNHCAVRTDEN